MNDYISREKAINLLKMMTEQRGYVELNKVLEFQDEICESAFCEGCKFESENENSSGCKLVDYFENLQRLIPSMIDMRGEE